MRRHQAGFLCVVAAASIGVLGDVQAQPSQSGADTIALETVVVTAEKRTESAQRTPIAIATVDQDQLNQSGVHGFQTIDKLVPDVQVRRWEGGLNIAVRGLVGNDVSPTAEQPNAVFIDGGYLTKAQALSGQFYDIARIEVLKGPQGTLYGRNATGGAINLITNRPSDTFSGNGEIEFGNYDLLRVEGAVNVPVSDTVFVRAAFQSYSHSGYMKSGMQDADEKSGRLSVLWKPTDKDTLFFSADLTHIGGIYPGSIQVVGRPPGSTATIPSSQDDTAYYGDARGHYATDEKQWGINIQYDHVFDWATATVQVTHRTASADDWNPGANPIGEADYVPAYFNDQTLEARLTSNSDRPVQWVAGFFAINERDAGTNAQYSSYTDVSDSGRGFEFANPYLRATSYAFFGQATYTPDFLDSLHITYGARQTWDRKAGETYTLAGPQSGGGCPCYLPIAGGSPMHGILNTNAFTYKAGLGYDITDSSMAYASFSTGYKAGGFSFGATPVYQPEYVKAWEVGVKNRFFDDTLQINAEAFLYKYRNYEEVLAFYIPSLYTVYASTVNAGQATYKGITLQALYNLTEADRFSLNAVVSSGRYGDNDLTPLVPTIYASIAGSHDLSNTSLVGIPRMSGNASYDHTWDAYNGTFDAQLAVQFRGKTLLANNAQNTPSAWSFSEGAWAMWDVALRYDFGGEHAWYVSGYIHNLTDGHHINNAGYGGNLPYIYGTYMPPRTFGVIAGAKF